MIARRIVMLAAVITAALVAGCSGIPQDDRYQTHDGGRSNTRAEAPAIPSPTVTATAELSTAR
jgi:hypothetical protein